MNRSVSVVFFGLFSTFSYAQEKKDETPEIVISPDVQYAEGTFPKDTKWQGLYCNKILCEIKNSIVNIDKKLVDDVEDRKVVLDDLKAEGKPLVLFAKENFKIGKVPTWHIFDGNMYSFWQSAQFVKLQKSGKWHMPWGKQPLTLSRGRAIEKKGYKSVKYSIGNGTSKQFLFEINYNITNEDYSAPIIHWVGDLDGDGKLDLILNIPDDSCGYDERLYLSSKAEKGTFLKEVIKNEGNQPACGC